MVLQMTAPQPSSNARPMTLALVPGGPEAMTSGLGNFKPSTVTLRSDMMNLAGRAEGNRELLDYTSHIEGEPSGPRLRRCPSRPSPEYPTRAGIRGALSARACPALAASCVAS